MLDLYRSCTEDSTLSIYTMGVVSSFKSTSCNCKKEKEISSQLSLKGKRFQVNLTCLLKKHTI